MINEELREVLASGQSALLTGGAGVGKSFNVKHLEHVFPEKRICYTATTGLASLIIGGNTIHRTVGMAAYKTLGDLAFVLSDPDRLQWMRANLETIDLLVIDEVSMLRGSQVDLIDAILKIVLDKQGLPFGGLQVLLVGDFCQLPPVVTRDERKKMKAGESVWAFDSFAWKELNPKVICLTKVMRQSDKEFIDALNKARFGWVDDESNALFESRVNAKIPDKFEPVKLYAMNKDVRLYNATRLMAIDQNLKSFTARIGAPDKKVFEQVQKDLDDMYIIDLKVGARVMTTVNYKDQFVNGSTGYVKEFEYNGDPVIEFDNGKTITVERYEFKRSNSKGEVVATVHQYPIKLAWALSIHKSQGSSLDYCEIDCNNIFTSAQMYVALSRARTLEGLVLKNWNRNSVWADDKAVDFYVQYMV